MESPNPYSYISIWPINTPGVTYGDACTASSSSLDNPSVCIIDRATTHSILKDRQLFHSIMPSTRVVTTIDDAS